MIRKKKYFGLDVNMCLIDSMDLKMSSKIWMGRNFIGLDANLDRHFRNPV